MLESGFRLGGVALDEALVGFFDSAVGKQRVHAGKRLGRFAEHDDSAGGAVKAVRKPNKRLTRLAKAARHVFGGPVE